MICVRCVVQQLCDPRQMQKKHGLFPHDSRNIGGRQAIIEHMVAHQSRLQQISSGKREFLIVALCVKLLRSVKNSKKGLDCGPPATLHM